jgi:hypothetical protein
MGLSDRGRVLVPQGVVEEDPVPENDGWANAAVPHGK